MPAREPVLKKFGGNVREKREARNLSQEALAEQADLDRTYIGGAKLTLLRRITGYCLFSPDCGPHRATGYSQRPSRIRHVTTE
jgi:hypothetical protein